jgi:hypothetical protein
MRRDAERAAVRAARTGTAAESAPAFPKTPEALQAWLKDALQAAVNLEFATIPPYLCALWSIKEELNPVAKSIREVVQEEMEHMAIACNLMRAIGVEPQIYSAAPRYPGSLPGDVHPGLEVVLCGLSPESLKVFLTIEKPSEFPENVETDEFDHVKPDRTIGEFYNCILEAFQRLNPRLQVDHQITGPLSRSVISDMYRVEEAIRLIQTQGEGAILGPLDTGSDDLAHYYRFKQIYREQLLVYDERDLMYRFRGKLPMPETWPMASVPKGGYRQDQVAPDVWSDLQKFDKTYWKLLQHLQNAWGSGGQGSLVHSFDVMFELERIAKRLVQVPRRAGGGNYGPCFCPPREKES